MSIVTRRAKRIDNAYDPTLPTGGIVRAVWEDAEHVRFGDEVITRAELRERYSVRSGWTVIISNPTLENLSGAL